MGDIAPESVKQAENSLAAFAKILSNLERPSAAPFVGER
jgi:hypothetical protein